MSGDHFKHEDIGEFRTIHPRKSKRCFPLSLAFQYLPHKTMGFIESLSLEQRIVGSIVSIAVAAIITRLTKPILWLRGNRSLKTLLNKDRDFVFTFNPTTKASKVVTFLANGEIGKGRNINEHTWKITKGGLDIFSQNGKLYSRFIYDKASGMLKHTNDANTRSIPGQYIQPHYLPQTESDISSKGRTG